MKIQVVRSREERTDERSTMFVLTYRLLPTPEERELLEAYHAGWHQSRRRINLVALVVAEHVVKTADVREATQLEKAIRTAWLDFLSYADVAQAFNGNDEYELEEEAYPQQ